MSVIRATALAGPGPTTLLYRTRLLARSSASGSDPSICASSSGRLWDIRTFGHTSRAVGPKRRRPLYDPSISTQDILSSLSASKHPAAARREKADDQKSDELPVIALRPPADYPIEDKLYLLNQAFESVNLDAALNVWSDLLDLGCTSRLTPEDWGRIASFVKASLTARNAPRLQRMAFKQPVKFFLLKDMAIQSAAHDCSTGLFWWMMKAIECGLPGEAVRAFTQCKEGMRVVQGKDARGILSWHRETRLAARLEGTGLRDLIFANIAALTLLNACDEHALFGMLDSQTNLRPSAYYDFSILERTFHRIKDGAFLYKRFRENVENLVLAMQCYHPDALVARINTLSASRTSGRLESLYDRIMQGSIGSDAFIRPRDLGELKVETQAYTNIPLAPIVWWQFIRAFERRNDVARIIAIIDTDMPARGLVPDVSFLSIAMVHMAIIASRPFNSAATRSEARHWVDEYWQRITNVGWHTEDLAFSRRVRVMSILASREKRMRDDLRTVYFAARDGHLGGIGPRTRAAFVESFMAVKMLQEALVAIEQLPLSSTSASNEKNQYGPALTIFIRRLALGVWSPQEKMEACNIALRLVGQKKVSLTTTSLGPLLAIQIQGGLPIRQAVDTILESTLEPGRSQHGIQRWTNVLSGLLIKANHSHSPTMRELQAGLYILGRATREELYGYTRTRLVAMFLSFLRPCATSTEISNVVRQTLIDEAMALFPDGEAGVSVGMWFDTIESLLSRTDGQGFGEAWRRWEQLTMLRDVPAQWWSKMLKIVLEEQKLDFAEDLVRDAWRRKEFGMEEGFWMRARQAGLTRKIGVEDHFVEFDKSFEPPVAQGGAGAGAGGKARKRWREPLSLALDVSEDEMDLDALEQEQDEQEGAEEENADNEADLDQDQDELVERSIRIRVGYM